MDDELSVGSHLAGYRIEGVAGRGGMGVVYIAEHLHLGRRVALKTLSAERGADEGFRERFIRESRLAARIDHPHIVPIYDAGEANGLLYLAMRLVGGGDLDTLIDTHAPLDVTMTLGMMRQIASALDAAHAEGLVHRDVKPGNVLLERTKEEMAPHCFLADFGLTKHASSNTALTSAGQLLGTLSYVAPEQIEGLDLDGRADQYSLACMLHECLTGAPPFRTESDSALPLIAAHLHEPPPPLSTSRPDLAGALDQALMRALAKPRADRYPDCTSLIDALEWAAGAPQSSPATALPPETREAPDAPEVPDAPHRPDVSAPTSNTEPTFTGDRHPTPTPEPEPDPEPEPATSEETRTDPRPRPPPPDLPGRPAGRPAGRRSRVGVVVAGVVLLLAVVGVVGAQVVGGGDDPGNGEEPGDIDPDDNPGDGPDPDPGPEPGPEPTPTPTPTPTDGGEDVPADPTAVTDPIVFTSERDGNRELYLARADGSGLRNITNHPADDWQASWSPDRTEVVFSSDRSGRFAIYTLRVDDGTVTSLTDGGPAGDFDPAWAPDGRGVVFSRDDNGRRDLYVVEVDDPQPRRLTDSAGSDARPTFSPDGTQIVFHSDRSGSLDIWVMDLDGTALRNLTDHPASDFHPVWSPDGDQIVWASERSGAGNIMIMRPDGTGQSALTESVAYDDLDPSFSPDGRFVVFESARDGRKEIYVVDADGGTPTRVTDHPADDRDPDW